MFALYVYGGVPGGLNEYGEIEQFVIKFFANQCCTHVPSSSFVGCFDDVSTLELFANFLI